MALGLKQGIYYPVEPMSPDIVEYDNFIDGLGIDDLRHQKELLDHWILALDDLPEQKTKVELVKQHVVKRIEYLLEYNK